MSQHNSIRVLLLQFHNGFHREALMHMTTTVPKQHIAACDAIDVTAQILIRTKDYLRVFWEGVNDFLRVAAGHHHIGQGFHGCRCIHITHHLIARMLVLVLFQVFGLTTVGQRTPRIQIRTKHQFLGTEYLTRLSHEMDTTHDDDFCIGLRGLLCQSQRIADEVSHLLNIAHRIIMR